MERRTNGLVLGCVLLLLGVAATPAGNATCAPGLGFCTPSPTLVYANPHWSIQLTSFGYSDFVIYRLPPFPRWDPRDPGGNRPIHEMASGEWAFGITYNGVFYWLEPCFVYPDWRTNSDFVAEVPINCPGDSDGDGISECFSVIRNKDLRIRIDYNFERATDGTQEGTALGRGALGPTRAAAAARMSDPYVLLQSFEIENISGAPIADLRLNGMLAAHPANTEYRGSDIAYDTTTFTMGGFQDYNYDLTAFATNSGLTDGFSTGSLWDDAVGYSLNFTPSDWDIDSYRGHQFGDDGITDDPVDANANGLKPLCGTHCNIETATMNNALVLLGDEVASGFRADLGALGTGQTTSTNVMLALASQAIGDSADSCGQITETGGDPILHLDKGACIGAAPTSFSYDISMGSLYELSRVADCGTGPMGLFDCSALVNLVCKGRQIGMDRVALDDDAHRTDLLFYLARRSGPFTSWGPGRNVASNPNDLLRFYFTSTTASGIDVCEPPGARAAAAVLDDGAGAPGVGQMEAVGLGQSSPRRERGLPTEEPLP